MFEVWNTVENKFIFGTNNEFKFIKFVQEIVIENEDFEFSILGMADAKEYIEEYCSNLVWVYKDCDDN